MPGIPASWPIATVARNLGVDVGDITVILQEHGDHVVDGHVSREACGAVSATLDPHCERTVPWLYRDVALDDAEFVEEMRDFLGAHAMPRLGPHIRGQ